MKKNKNEFNSEEIRAGLDKYYFKNRDFKLLLDLLATNYGTMTSLRLLAMVDKGFGEKFKPSDLKFAQPHYHERKTEINIANEENIPVIRNKYCCIVLIGNMKKKLLARVLV